MLIGAHAIIYSTNGDADRKFLKDVLGLTHVDVGGGWLIFGLPPSEVAIHPSSDSQAHELYLMSDDIEGFVADMKKRGIACSAVSNQGWGLLTSLTLPGGGTLGVYQPRHARPAPMSGGKAPKASKKSAKKSPKKASKKSAKKPAKKLVKKAPKRQAKRR